MRFNKLLFSILASLFFVTFFVSCDESASDFGLEVLPSDEMIKVKINDTIQITSDQIIFNEERLPLSDNIFLGAMKDSVFGEMKASLYTQFFPRVNPFDALYNPSRVTLISFKLHIEPDVTYTGGANDRVVIDVYPLSDTLSKYKSYNYNFPGASYIDKSKAPLATFELNSAKILSGFDVELSKAFADRILQCNSAELSKINMHVPGLCFLPRSHTGTGLMASIDFNYSYSSYSNDSTPPASYMKLKYNTSKDSILINSKWVKKDTTLTDSIMFDFSSYRLDTAKKAIVYKLAKANPLNYAYTNSVAKTSLNGDLNDTCMYIANRGGAKIRYNLSQLSKFPVVKNSLISKAEIVIPIEKNYFVKNNINKSQLKVFLVRPDSVLYRYYTELFLNVSSDVSGNVITSKFDTITNSYKVDITDYVENYVKGKTTVRDVIITMNSSSFLEKAVLKKNKKPTLKIKYTIF